MRIRFAIVGWLAVCCPGDSLYGQTSSLGARKREENATRRPDALAAEIEAAAENRVYRRYSWITADPAPPKTFQVEDLVTIIVRENRKYEADADSKSESDFKVQSSLDAFFKPIDGGLGSSTFSRGKPNIDYEWKNRQKNRGDASREDRLTFRITAKVIDVKPNGLLTLEGRFSVQHEEEISSVTITGTCRKEDILPDNTVLSTQMADKTISVDNKGPVRDAAKRGFVSKILGIFKPF